MMCWIVVVIGQAKLKIDWRISFWIKGGGGSGCTSPSMAMFITRKWVGSCEYGGWACSCSFRSSWRYCIILILSPKMHLFHMFFTSVCVWSPPVLAPVGLTVMNIFSKFQVLRSVVASRHGPSHLGFQTKHYVCDWGGYQSHGICLW